MVHYGPDRHAAQLPPPICPKCGSHRTQVVGRSNDAKFMVLRCNACGERSTVAYNDFGAAELGAHDFWFEDEVA
jgi:transcription elongation factor Elf1